MGRNAKQTVDYFPHFVADGKTKRILSRYWGNDGYAFWFKMLELLCSEDGHFLDLSCPIEWEDFLAYVNVEHEIALNILAKLAELEKIDYELWHHNKIVWCQSLVENLQPVYGKRVISVPEKPTSNVFPSRKCNIDDISDSENQQSKVEKSKVENTSATAEEGAAAANDSKSPPVPFKKIMELYNSICVSFPKIQLIDGSREDAVRARFNKHKDIKTFDALFRKAEASDFLKGGNDRNWRADFDWLMIAANLAKVLEGKYDNERWVKHAKHSGNIRDGTPKEYDLTGFTVATAEDFDE